MNRVWAAAFVEGLVANGVRHAVLSPGARSTPLALACHEHDRLQTWVIQDERSAAFFALGISKTKGMPAAIIGTSGSAPANWYPAVIEAALDYQPLILISADRPGELHGCGANQTIDQHRLFGVFTREYFDLGSPNPGPAGLRFAGDVGARAVADSLWPTPGPVHINAPFPEPLVPEEDAPSTKRVSPSRVSHARLDLSPTEVRRLAAWLSGRQGVIVCGRGVGTADFADAVTGLASRLACPILADPLSGLRFGSHNRSALLCHYDTFLASRRFVQEHPPQWVLQFGALPTSKSLQAYIGPVSDKALVVPYGPWPDPGRQTGWRLRADPTALCEQLNHVDVTSAHSDWWDGFQNVESRARSMLSDESLAPHEARLMQAIFGACPNGTRVFCGNSMAVRDVDAFVSGSERVVSVFGNRGASGIDGNVSTALGMAAAAEGPVVALLGDLAMYHDMNGLIAATGLHAVLIVFNNGGGGIFSYLPQAHLPEFDRYWRTPLGIDFANVARLYDIGFDRVSETQDLLAVLQSALDRSRVTLIEVIVDHTQSVRRHRAYVEAVANG